MNRACCLCLSAALLVLSLVPAPARALESQEVVLKPSPERREFGMVPLIGGDSDIGVAIGAIGSAASFTEAAHPYVWRTELSAMSSFKHDNAGWTNPFQDYYAKATLPSMFNNQFTLSMRAAYTRYNHLLYYGLGNASQRDDAYKQFGPHSSDYKNARQRHEFELAYPHATLEALVKAWSPFQIKLLFDYQYNQARVYEGSLILQDLQRGRITGGGTFGVYTGGVGLVWDSRDNETAPTSGALHNLSVRASPGHLMDTPYTYGGVNASLRHFFPLWGQHLVLATRVVGDVLAGDVPFFTLSESEDGYALGGGRGVRGIPAQRYYGKVKTYGNAELRVQFPSFPAFDQEMVLGFVAFADGGRVWADLRSDAALDGQGAGLKYGVGGGVRMQLGETFLLRGDAAWSPDADPVAFYFNVGQVF